VNIALPAIIIFSLVLPGFIVRTNIRRASKTSLDFSPFGKMVATSLMWAAVLHIIWIAMTQILTGNKFDPEILMGLLSSEKSLQASSIHRISAQFEDIALYFITLYIACLILPKAVRFFVDKYSLDGLHSRWSWIFRFDDADWFYLFSGVDFKKHEKPDFISISAVVEVGKESYIYKGALDDYFTDSDGNLTRIVLSGASRRKLEQDRCSEGDQSEADPRFYEINGDYFVLKYDEISSLNVHYIKIIDSKNSVSKGAVLTESAEEPVRATTETDFFY